MEKSNGQMWTGCYNDRDGAYRQAYMGGSFEDLSTTNMMEKSYVVGRTVNPMTVHGPFFVQKVLHWSHFIIKI